MPDADLMEDSDQTTLEQWWVAVLKFIDVRALIWHSAPYESIISKLQEAQPLYQSVGDEVMATRVSQYITAFQLLSEGETKKLGKVYVHRGVNY